MPLRTFCLVVFLAASTRLGLAAAPRQIAADVMPSVVLLTTFDANGLPLRIGSGFVIANDEIATNFHVLSEGFRVTAKAIESSTAIEVLGVIAVDQANDLAVLKTAPSAIRPLGLSTTEPAIGDSIYIAGNPEGLEGTFSSGLVSAKREIEGKALIQISAPISPGSSGSPVVNEQGTVIGVAVSSLQLGQSLNFAVPVSRLASIHRNLEPRSMAASCKAVKAASEPLPADRTNDPDFRRSDGMLTAYAFTRDANRFSFTVKNSTQSPICNINFVAIAYGKDGRPLDSTERTLTHVVIPPNLAKRFGEAFAFDLPPGLIERYEVRLIQYSVYDATVAYTVKAGDSLTKIARTLDISAATLEAANPDIDWARLRLGQRVKIHLQVGTP